MLGNVIEIELVQKEDGMYFRRFFFCFKPSINGFLNGCRPYLSIDSTTLNGRWNGHKPSATRSIGTTGYFQLHLDFFMEKPLRIEIDFMQQLQKGTGNPPNLAISSDVCKGIEKAVKAVFLGQSIESVSYA